MKKILLVVILGLGLTGSASAAGLGIGAYGGVAIPVLQDDQGNGTVFGLKAKLKLIPGVSFEPNINFMTYGDAELEFGTLEGSKVTYFGADLILGSVGAPVGPRVYFLGGAGLYSTSRDVSEDASDFGFNVGLGIEIGFGGALALDLRGKGHMVMFEGASKKFGTITGGINYYLGI